jgi:thiosulfate/3-mercaptopyruvate sulfurtransferase
MQKLHTFKKGARMKRLLKTLLVAATLTLVPAMAGTGYAKNDVLISPEEAIKLIGNPKVMFVSGDSPDVYELGHIKGSVEMYAHHLHHSDIMGNMHCDPLFRCIDDAEHYIGSKGISNDTMIIAYDDFKGPNATGVYAFFKSYGHDNVKILNGGREGIKAIDPAQIEYDKYYQELRSVKKAGKKDKKKLKDVKKGKIEVTAAEKKALEKSVKANKAEQKALKAKLAALEPKLMVVKGKEHVAPKKFHIDPKKLNLKRLASKGEVAAAAADIEAKGEDSKFVIIDTRGMTEIIGERKMDNVARGGHVPGATFIEWKKISDTDNKKSFRSAEKLKAVFEKYGVTKDKTIYAYCHVGTGRSSEIITALELLGYPNAKIFTGSWDTWGNDMNLPIKK